MKSGLKNTFYVVKDKRRNTFEYINNKNPTTIIKKKTIKIIQHDLLVIQFQMLLRSVQHSTAQKHLQCFNAPEPPIKASLFISFQVKITCSSSLSEHTGNRKFRLYIDVTIPPFTTPPFTAVDWALWLVTK